MLVLQRYRGEAIRIGECGEITIKILGFQNGQVRVGVEAPKAMPVNREEIHQRKKLNDACSLKFDEAPNDFNQPLNDQDDNNHNDEGTPLC